MKRELKQQCRNQIIISFTGNSNSYSGRTDISSTTIDLAFTNIHKADIYICDLGLADHDAVLLAEPTKKEAGEQRRQTEPKLKLDKNTIKAMKDHLNSIDWTYLHTMPAEKGFASLHETIKREAEKHLAYPKNSKKGKPWMTAEIKKTIDRKNKLYRKQKMSLKAEDIASYTNVKKQLRTLIKTAKKRQLIKEFEAAKGDSKKDLGANQQSDRKI